MTERHLIVCQRDSAWQYTYRGTITAPFSSRDEAIEAAIAEAREINDAELEVVVQDQDMTQETVWRPEK